MPEPLLIFDGECGFCTSAATFIRDRWSRPARTEAWQQLGSAGLSKLGLTTEQVRQAAWWVDGSGHLYRGHLAVAGALRAAGGWYRVLGVIIPVPPVRWAADLAYRAVSRWRGHLPGGPPAWRP